MDRLRTLLFAVIFYSGSTLFVLASAPIAAFGTAALTAHAICWVRFHRWCARALLGVRSRIEGEAPRGPVIVAAKHQAMYEALELLAILDRPAVVFKRELADIPIWGRVAKTYGAIPVDREGSAKALRAMLADARRLTADGRAILIFPEGTRVRPGERPPLRPGFAGLYRMLRVPVVPVAIDSGRLFPRDRFARSPGTVTFRFGAPIPPGLPREEIERRVHAAINALD